MEATQESQRPRLLRGQLISICALRPLAKADTKRNNRLVWDETVKIMLDLFENVWGEKKEVVYDNVLDMTLPVSVYPAIVEDALTALEVAMFVIAVAGFGRRVSWQTDLVAPEGHKLAFKVHYLLQRSVSSSEGLYRMPYVSFQQTCSRRLSHLDGCST